VQPSPEAHTLLPDRAPCRNNLVDAIVSYTLRRVRLHRRIARAFLLVGSKHPNWQPIYAALHERLVALLKHLICDLHLIGALVSTQVLSP
jgi:hypothetical protein